ncbi:MAG: hypothetical protein ABIN25_13730, partial [Ginsengibacter sp.]
MKKISISFFAVLVVFSFSVAQVKDSSIINALVEEANDNSHLKSLAHELFDEIGPRLTGTPKMKQAHDWAVAKYHSWGAEAKNEKWGEWRGWERGITHVDMISPWVKSLEGTQLAWSPSTKGKAVTASIIIVADVMDSLAF